MNRDGPAATDSMSTCHPMLWLLGQAFRSLDWEIWPWWGCVIAGRAVTQEPFLPGHTSNSLGALPWVQAEDTQTFFLLQRRWPLLG